MEGWRGVCTCLLTAPLFGEAVLGGVERRNAGTTLIAGGSRYIPADHRIQERLPKFHVCLRPESQPSHTITKRQSV
jgi:hypothetical protein